MALTKVSGGILDPGIDVAGIVTATGFDGPFTGGSSKNINAGIITATGFDLNGNGDISGNLVVGGNLTANGDFTTLNTTLREVEILRVDANTSAVAGIITQRGSGDIFAAFDGSTPVFRVADGGAVSVLATGDNKGLRVHSNSGISATNNELRFNTGQSSGFTFMTNSDGGASNERLRITSTGAVGIATATPIDDFTVLTEGNGYFGIDGGGGKGAEFNVYHKDTKANTFKLANNGGTNELAQYALTSTSGKHIWHIGGTTNEKMRLTTTGLGIGTESPETNLTIAKNATNQTVATIPTVRLTNLDTTAVATDIVGSYEFFSKDVHSNNKVTGFMRNTPTDAGVNYDLTFGTIKTGDSNAVEKLRIRSDGGVGIGTNNNFNGSTLSIYGADIGEGTAKGQLVIKDTAAYDASPTAGIIFQGIHAVGSQAIFAGIRGFKENATNGNYAGALAFDVRAQGAVASEALRINSDGDVLISHTTTPSADIKLLVGGNAGVTDGKYFSFRASYGNTSEPAAHAIKFDSAIGSSGGLHYYGYGGMHFDLGGQPRIQFTQTGNILPNAVGSLDIGSATAEIGNVYIADDKRFYAGSDQNISLYHNNTTGINYLTGHPGNMFYQSATHYFTDAAQSKIQAQFIHNSYCELRHAGNLKFRTSETGIDVTGEVAASQDYPDFRPTLDLNFTAEKKLDPRITYQRTGVASFVNEFGKLIIVGDNAPRFDHDPTTRECKGLLIEEGRTNQWLYSEDLVTYVTGGNLQQSSLANTTATTDPTGGTNAVKMAATATGGAHSFYKNFTSGSNGDVHTASVWVKAAGVDYARIYVDTVGGNMGGPGVTFSTGNTWNVSASGSATQTATSVVEYPNGWWRLSVSGSFSNQNAYYVHIDLEGGEGDVSFTGNGSNGMYVWGVQFESGIFSTSYMPTSGRSVTRGEDVVRIMDDDFTDIFGTEFENFSVVADFDNSNSADAINASILEWWGESTGYTDRIQIFKDNSSPYHVETRSFGGNTAIFSNGNLSASSKTASNRFATSWSVDYSTNSAESRRWAFSFSGEDVDVVNDHTGTTTPTLTRFGIGCSPTRLDFTRGTLLFKRLMVYNQTLSDNQLRTLSS